MAKTGFYQTNPTVEETVSTLVETTTDLSSTDDKAKTSFYQGNSTIYETLASTSARLLYARFVVFKAGKTTNGELLGRFLITDDISFALNLDGSLASGTVAATGETVYTIAKNGSTKVTVTFDAASTTGVFAGSAFSVTSGDVLTLEGPATADATLANISFTLAGTREV